MLKLQKKIETSWENRYKQILEYLKQDNGYWLNNDIWNYKEDCFYGKTIQGTRTIKFVYLDKKIIKNEIKYFILKSFKDDIYKSGTIRKISDQFKYINMFFEENYKNIESIMDIVNKSEMILKWNNFLFEKKIKAYKSALETIYDYIQEYYKNLDEIQKDVWYVRNIKGARIPASVRTGRLDFTPIPQYYKDEVKKYFSVIITKKSYRECAIRLSIFKFFFRIFYEKGYKDGFLENLTREDVEKYLYWLNEKEFQKGSAHKAKSVSYIRDFIKYLQIAEYIIAPKIEVYKLFFEDDVPKRENCMDIIKRVKYIPTLVLEQIDENIDYIKDKEIVAVYKLARETGWRGTDILNLRYNNCLEQIWNTKENKYNYYLCGEITKTGIAELKVPIHNEIANMVEDFIKIAQDKSTEVNNPKKYLFNTYTGKSKGRPIRQLKVVLNIRKLIEEKQILDANGNVYHFKMHSLRHTRAKEYIEQGIGIEIVQQMLGHRSLQMTMHYSTVSENILYEKWKKTEKLQLFKLNNETKQLKEIDINNEQNEKIVRYEYVKENLDAVKVPFGVCFKSKKVQCKNQLTQCLECASFCSTTENIEEYEKEIKRIKKQIEIAKNNGRNDWIERNTERLKILEKFLERIKEEKVIHKNQNSREEQ